MTAVHAPARSLASDLATWAAELTPSAADLALARRALVDTVAVSVAARGEPLVGIAGSLGLGGRLAVAAHVHDYDDLHVASTSHVSAVCVPAAIASGGDARAYLAAAGVMARLGARMGWGHYERGWHATCTTGAPAAAIAAGIAIGLDADGLARAMALSVPAAGGNHRAFGTHASALQVGFAVDAGLRAAQLAAAGATADLGAVEAMVQLLGGTAGVGQTLDDPVEAVPGGLALRLHPCSYALQRPIAAVRAAIADHGPLDAREVSSVTVTAPIGTLRSLVRERPSSGAEGRFSLEYAVAAAVLDGFPRIDSFSDDAVRRPAARTLMRRIDVRAVPGGGGLLTGNVGVQLRTTGGAALTGVVGLAPGAPHRPATQRERAAKVQACAGADAEVVSGLEWADAAAVVPPLVVGGEAG